MTPWHQTFKDKYALHNKTQQQISWPRQSPTIHVCHVRKKIITRHWQVATSNTASVEHQSRFSLSEMTTYHTQSVQLRSQINYSYSLAHSHWHQLLPTSCNEFPSVRHCLMTLRFFNFFSHHWRSQRGAEWPIPQRMRKKYQIRHHPVCLFFQTQSAPKPVFGRGCARGWGAYDAPTPPSRLVSTGIAREAPKGQLNTL